MDSPNFDVKARIPVRPLSYENKDKAMPKELIIDYTNGSVYITDSDGNIINVNASPETVQAIIQYFEQNPDAAVFLKLTGGTLTGHLFFAKGSRIQLFGDHSIPYTAIYMGDDNNIHIGHFEEAIPICIDGPIILNSNNFGSTLPENPIEGQLFFQIIEEE